MRRHCLLLFLVLSATAAAAADPADVIYSGGDILTMQGPTPEYVECLAIRDGKIQIGRAHV